MKRFISILAAALVTFSAVAEDFTGFSGIAFGSPASSLRTSMMKNGWSEAGMDYASFDSDFYAYSFKKDDDSFHPDAIVLANAYSDDKFYIAIETYQLASTEMLDSVTESGEVDAATIEKFRAKLTGLKASEEAAIAKYNLTRCSADEAKALSDFFTFDSEEDLNDGTEVGFYETSCSRFYKSANGNHFVILVEEVQPGMNLAWVIYGLSDECLKAKKAPITAPKLKVKKNSSEVFEGIPFGTNIFSAIKVLRASSLSVLDGMNGGNDISMLIMGNPNGKTQWNGVEADYFMLAEKKQSLILGSISFNEPDAVTRAKIGNIEKDFIKQYKLNKATKADVEAYCNILGDDFWTEDANTTEAGDMTKALRIYKAKKEGTIFAFSIEEDGIAIMRLAKPALWQ